MWQRSDLPREALEQRHDIAEREQLSRAESFAKGLLKACRNMVAPTCEDESTRWRDRSDHTPSIYLIGHSADQASFREPGEHGADGLGADLLAPGERGRVCRPEPIEARQDGELIESDFFVGARAGMDLAHPPGEVANREPKPLGEVADLAALTAASVAHEITTYPGAPHSFFDVALEAFTTASTDAWRQTIEFIARFGSRAPG